MDKIVYDRIDDLSKRVEYYGGGIESLLNGRVVKSVQSGTITFEKGGQNQINISPVNTSKSIIIFPTSGSEWDTSRGITMYFYGWFNSSNQIGLFVNMGNSKEASTSWQVIEFY